MQEKELKPIVEDLLSYDWITPQKMIFHLSMLILYAHRHPEYPTAFSSKELEDMHLTAERLLIFLNAISLFKKETS